MTTMRSAANVGQILKRTYRTTSLIALLIAIGLSASSGAEVCITQSGMVPADRTAIAGTALNLSNLIQASNATGLRSGAVAELGKDFTALQYLVSSTAPKLAGGTPVVQQIYLLDASSVPKNPDGSNPEAQFFCSLNRTTTETEFLIPSLPPGKYAFAIVTVNEDKAAPWRLSFLMRQEQGKWLLAGFYPRAMTAAGHDGLWYWTQARQMTTAKQPWDAWLYYRAAEKLLQPADFLNSTHLDKLHTEAASAAPPALSEGVSADAPLVVKGAGGAEYHFIGLGVDDSLGQSSLDIEAHLHVDASAADPVAARKLNNDAAAALLAAYPELRKPFHGVWIYAEAVGQNPFATEQPMADIK